ncbi:hypothetical protein [Wolbachia endosymbiont of Aedes albopictus]|uniref:hypothetical protein n=1 Tax=Wolbachia endosymbiont of Aedes albopictus TaxID=167957 RepID=UPI002167B117|nr:hypothetical protein [Wolbachia endosymbiont of Aedes albopictus]UVW83587.1 hypothetical protein NHG98_04385 [Wolbachia endosymbiont of Aedes albopictus]
MSFQSGIQVAHKQTSIESGYNVFDEIAGRLDSSVTRWNDKRVGCWFFIWSCKHLNF